MTERKNPTTRLSDMSLVVVYAPNDADAPVVCDRRPATRLSKVSLLATYAPEVPTHAQETQ